MWMWLAMIGMCTATATSPDEISLRVREYNAHASFKLPALDAQQSQRLVAGEVVRILFQNEDPEQPSAAVAMAVVDVSRNALWIAAQDPHTKVDPGLTEKIIAQLEPDRALWYGHWDLPRPVRDRQWVVESWNNHELAAALDNVGWEHAWKLVPDGLERARPFVARGEVGAVTVAQLDAAIYTPMNRGAWFMINLSDGETLFGYQATSVVGGAIPSWLVQRLAMTRLETILRDLETRAREWSPKHYASGHAPVYGGDGQTIPPW